MAYRNLELAMTKESSITKPQTRRPTSVTLLAEGVLITAAINLIRFFLTLKDWDFLAGLQGAPPLYLAISGAAWGLILLPIGLGLYLGKRWSLWAVQGAVPLYLVYFWLDRLALNKPFSVNGKDQALPFYIGLTALIVLFLLITVNRKKTRSYFGVIHER